MKNLAGDQKCDVFIREELRRAGIEIVEVPKTRSEVPYTLVGKINGWMFYRAWYYWMAQTSTGKGISENQAEEMNAKWFSEVRVAGFAGGTEVNGWLSSRRTIDNYHIDSQEGLNAFAELVRKLKK